MMLAFASPWILLGLLILPLVWLLLRSTPPKPVLQFFPPVRLLLDIASKEKTPAHMPLWLLLLRLLMIAIIIFAMAGPFWRANETLAGSGPILLLVDNGLASAEDWSTRQQLVRRLLDQADRDERIVAFHALAEAAPASLVYENPKQVETGFSGIQPRSWRSDYGSVQSLIDRLEGDRPQSIWFVASSMQATRGDQNLQKILPEGLSAELVVFTSDRSPAALAGLENEAEGLKVRVLRGGAEDGLAQRLVARDARGDIVGSVNFQFKTDAQETLVSFALPTALRNEIARIEIDSARNASAVQLLDERFRRRRVGLLSGHSADLDQPLLSPKHYLNEAMRLSFDLIDSDKETIAQSVEEIVGQKPSVIISANVGRFVGEAYMTISSYVEDGGTLVRFAGSNMASDADDLLPVTLRGGQRLLDGSLTWSEPQAIDQFSEIGPLAGLAIDRDIKIKRQILAEPTLELPDKTWASLADGTPLITAAKRGKGWIILIHVGADAGWSNLPLSGQFVEILKRFIVFSGPSVSSGQRADDARVLRPLSIVDGYGGLVPPPEFVKALESKNLDSHIPTLQNPPGVYRHGNSFRAVNALGMNDRLARIDFAALMPEADLRSFEVDAGADLRIPLIITALLLFLADCFAVYWIAGFFARFGRQSVAASLAFFCAFVLVDEAALADDAVSDFTATLQTRLAYVVTGNRDVDFISERGLAGLSEILRRRTAIEPGPPIGLNIEQDELSFYPFLYWPMTPDRPLPSLTAIERIDAFMKNGGTILFDTADYIESGGDSSLTGVTEATNYLRRLLLGLDIPPLEVVPENHVLTKAFYILGQFPGRYSGGDLWIEALPKINEVVSDEFSDDDGNDPALRPALGGDGISPVLITSNNMAAAWAIDEAGRYLRRVVPDDRRQREFAFRAGVNIIMYTLTGNYKADQVHIPALLERLGQ